MSDTSPSTSHDNEPFDLEREPLDRPLSFARDWGGDGTDVSRPVRAHLLAALRPNSAPYTPPVDALIALGEPRKPGVAERRAALGLRQEHLPELLRMARDRHLYTANGDTDEVWAPLHAFYALSNLDVSAVVPELILLFDLDDDWLDTALPELAGHSAVLWSWQLLGWATTRSMSHFGMSTIEKSTRSTSKVKISICGWRHTSRPTSWRSTRSCASSPRARPRCARHLRSSRSAPRPSARHRRRSSRRPSHTPTAVPQRIVRTEAANLRPRAAKDRAQRAVPVRQRAQVQACHGK